MSGPHLFQVSLDFSTILCFLMTLHSLCGRSPFGTSLTSPKPSYRFMLSSAHSSLVPFGRFRLTTAENLTTPFSDNGIILRLSCPYTSQQNGKAERILRTLNDGVCALLLHAALPPAFWVEALQTSTFLLNRKPCKPRSLSTPFSLLFNTDPDYTLLRVFGCLCYPNTTSTSPNKLSPRSVACVFIGYSQPHGMLTLMKQYFPSVPAW